MFIHALKDIRLMISFTEQCFVLYKPTVVSCEGSYGRTGCMLSSFFITRGMQPLAALLVA